MFHYSFSDSLKSKLLKGKIGIFSIFLGLANDIGTGVLRTNYIGAISSALKGVMKYNGEIVVQVEDLGSGYIHLCGEPHVRHVTLWASADSSVK